MDRRCEFCKALCPIVYCKADTAHLCLSCDSKVHSANALSYRHPRTLVCEFCEAQPASVRCIDHEMFMCRSCDTNHHASFQHQRKVVTCYVGCPSAKDLAALWGFDMNEWETNFVSKDQSVSLLPPTTDSGAVNSSVSNVSCLQSEISSLVSGYYTEYEVRSSSLGAKVGKDDNRHQKSYLILRQIQDLERLQLSESVDKSCLLQIRKNSAWKSHKTLNTEMEQHFSGDLEEKSEELLLSPFSQMDHLTSTANPLQGGSFWQCKIPAHNNEAWLQNMQDIGVCDEVKWFDDVNIPDVDLTFRNFEEVFGAEHETIKLIRAPIDDKNTGFSSADKHRSNGKTDRGLSNTIEQSNRIGRDMDNPGGVHPLQTSNHPIRPSHSTSSFSVSRITGDSSGSEYKDDGLSPAFPLPHSLQDLENPKSDNRGNTITRHREKKVLSRQEQQARITFLRSKSDVKKRTKSQVLKAAGGRRGSVATASSTRSF